MTQSPFSEAASAAALVSIAAAVSALALVAAGCGGNSSSSASGAAATIAATTAQAKALAFARCVRSHGFPNWPDPTSDGGFDKFQLHQLGLSMSRVHGSCNRLLPPYGVSSVRITPADQADYLKAAACMRSHGFPDFPDPTFANNTVTFDNAPAVDPNSLPAKRAEAICVKLIPPDLPYGHNSGP